MVNTQPIRSSNPALNVLKNVGASPLFLVATILQTLNVVLGLVSSIFVSSSAGMGNLINFTIRLDGIDYSDIAPYLQMSQGFTPVRIFSAILTAVPGILFAVGMWLTWATCRSMASGNISTTGLTMCRVILILYRVVIIIALVLMIIGGIAFLVLRSSLSSRAWEGDVQAYNFVNYSGAPMMAVVTALLIAGTAAAVLLLCYYISACRVVTRIRQTAMTGVPDSRISMFLIVMLWILGISGALSSITMFLVSPLAGAAVVAAGVGKILLAVCLKKYRDDMAALMPVGSPYSAQPYQQPYGAPQQPYPQQGYGQPVYPQQRQAGTYQPQQPGYGQQPYQAPVQPYQQPTSAPQQPYQAPAAPQAPAPQEPQDPTQQG